MSSYLDSFQTLLVAHANAENAASMKAYMKGRFEFYGIKSPDRRILQKQYLDEYGMPEPFDKGVFLTMWQQDHREMQMFGLDLLRRQAKQAKEVDLDLIEQLIITKSWWDSVDGLAVWVCGPYFLKFPHRMRSVTDKWAVSENMWLRRSSIIFQLSYKQKTQVDLLTDHIEKNLGTKEFFINKAIGWALREYGKTGPDFVRAYVSKMESKMHPLSVREALKNL